MRKPRLLDLFCGAGGAAKGYSDAGFDVFGVDKKWQPHYPYEMAVGDALTLGPQIWHEYDAVHASPPCQGYSRMRHLPWTKGGPLLIEPMKELLVASGLPWVIENVMDAPLEAGWLCGSMFGLPFYRHRKFATNWLWLAPPHSHHRKTMFAGRMLGARLRESHASMELKWMTKAEQAEAIPPAYTEYIGKRLMEYLNV